MSFGLLNRTESGTRGVARRMSGVHGELDANKCKTVFYYLGVDNYIWMRCCDNSNTAGCERRATMGGGLRIHSRRFCGSCHGLSIRLGTFQIMAITWYRILSASGGYLCHDPRIASSHRNFISRHRPSHHGDCRKLADRKFLVENYQKRNDTKRFSLTPLSNCWDCGVLLAVLFLAPSNC